MAALRSGYPSPNFGTGLAGVALPAWCDMLTEAAVAFGSLVCFVELVLIFESAWSQWPGGAVLPLVVTYAIFL